MLLAQMEAADDDDEQLRHGPGSEVASKTRETAYFDDDEEQQRASRGIRAQAVSYGSRAEADEELKRELDP